jgi:hypothetical protein
MVPSPTSSQGESHTSTLLDSANSKGPTGAAAKHPYPPQGKPSTGDDDITKAALVRDAEHPRPSHDEHEHNEKEPIAPLGPSPIVAKRNRKRTMSGTGSRLASMQPTPAQTPEGTVRSVGMTPISRQLSLPPAVGMWGGVAPSGPDADAGLRAVRSHEEEMERDEIREKNGVDPWAVKFEPGEKINPKVSEGERTRRRWADKGRIGAIIIGGS